MNHRKAILGFFVFWITSSWIGSLGLPSVEAQSAQHDIQESVILKQEGGFLLKSSAGKTQVAAPLLHTDVNITISGLIVRTTVSQQFTNPGPEWAEGVYVFPLPEQAAVDHLRMKIGERIIEGQIQERAQAKKTYANAKAKGRRASLLEQERPNIFTASLANIPPQATITVDIEYQEMVRDDQGRFMLRFPMVVGPRYIPGQPNPIHEHSNRQSGLGWASDTGQVPDASRITPPVQHPKGSRDNNFQEFAPRFAADWADLNEHNRKRSKAYVEDCATEDRLKVARRWDAKIGSFCFASPKHGPLNPITMHIDLAPGMPLQDIESPTHPITVTQQGNNTYQLTLQDSSTYANRDFELIWTPLASETPQATVFTEAQEGETYLFLQLMPPATPSSTQETIPREVIFVIDTSGSMAGASLIQAKAALKLALTRLTPKDSFNLIQFHSITHALYSTSQPASVPTVQEALRYLDSLQANGGTEMRPALMQALSQTPNQQEHHRLRQIIFITDGLIGNEDALFTILQRNIGQNRLFTIGIGSAPNGHFMRKAAQIGRGTFTYIGTAKEVQDTMNRLFQKLEHPALTDITINASNAIVKDMMPDPLPDLYVGEPITIALRTSSLPPSITIRGRQGKALWETKQSLADSQSRNGIAVYWARQKIAQLMDHHRRNKDKSLLRQQILDIALKHHLVSRYTSLVAVDVTPVRPETHKLHTHPLKTNLPHGVQYEAIFGWPQTATPGTLYLLLGISILWIALLWSRQHLAHR